MHEWQGERMFADPLTGSGRIGATVGEKLGGGGEGAVYRDGARPAFVLKLMHQRDARVERKIRAMLAHAPVLQLEQDQDGRAVIQIAWPQEIITDSAGRFSGFSMRLLDSGATVPLNAWFDRRSRARNNLSQSDVIRVYLAANLASVTEYINQAGHAVVDFKPQNVLAYRKHGYVCLVDCDGFSIRSGNDVFPAAAGTPGFLAPEHHANFDPRRLDEKQDRFALAILIHMLLDNGWHPSSGASSRLPPDLSSRLAQGAVFIDPQSGLTPPKNSHSAFFSDETIRLFKRAFTGRPQDRPSSREWKEHLRELTTQLVQCSKEKTHWHYGKGCPWCKLAGSRSAAKPAPGRLQIAVPAQHVSRTAAAPSTPSIPPPAAHPRQPAPMSRTAAASAPSAPSSGPSSSPPSPAPPPVSRPAPPPSHRPRVTPRKPPGGSARRLKQVLGGILALLLMVYWLSTRGTEPQSAAERPPVKKAPAGVKSTADAPPPPGPLPLNPANQTAGIEAEKLREEAVKLYSGLSGRINDKQAEALFRKADAQGDPLARMWLARSYYMGLLGLPKDTSRGHALARTVIDKVRAEADRGSIEAAFLLASAYQEGLAVARDYSRAEQLYQRACSPTMAVACANLARMYQMGTGVARNSSRAAKLQQAICDGGSPYGCSGLGDLYRLGAGVPQDESKAADLYWQACERGYLQACVNLAWLYRNAKVFPKDEAKAVELYQYACDGGNAYGCGGYAGALADGRGAPKDEVKAADLYRRACDGGSAEACGDLGWALERGAGTPKDPTKAAALYRQACNQQHWRSCTNLGRLYEWGTAGIRSSLSTAATYYGRGCEGGDAAACNNLGVLYAQGSGVPRDDARAADFYRRACEAGSSPGCSNLGWRFAQGLGVPKNDVRAVALFRLACDNGAADGCSAMKELCGKSNVPGCAQEAAQSAPVPIEQPPVLSRREARGQPIRERTSERMERADGPTSLAPNDRQATLIRKVEPHYPPFAKQARVQGTVTLRAVVGANGRVRDVAVVSGHPILSRLAVAAVRQWVYQPAMRNGRPVESETRIEVSFTVN
jgi:TonB family protein